MASKLIVGGEILLHGVVDPAAFPGLEGGFTARDVRDALAEVGDQADVTVRINSGGGAASEGAAIYSALRGHRGQVTTVIEGIAASAGSVVAMAGDEIVMAVGSVLMIHDPWSMTVGPVAEHLKQIEALTAMGDTMAAVYAEQTGRSPAQERQVMVNETWLTAEQAVDLGYADRLDKAPASEPAAFNYAAYARAPAPLVAMARANGWGAPAAASTPTTVILMPRKPRGALPAASVPPADPSGKDETMTEKSPAEIEAAAVAEAATRADDIPVETMVAAAVGAERARFAEIEALCGLAGMPELAMGFGTSGKSVDEVKAALVAAKAKAGENGGEIGSRARTTPDPAANWDKAIEAVNARIA